VEGFDSEAEKGTLRGASTALAVGCGFEHRRHLIRKPSIGKRALLHYRKRKRHFGIGILALLEMLRIPVGDKETGACFVGVQIVVAVNPADRDIVQLRQCGY
jgi:hypothetical protein